MLRPAAVLDSISRYRADQCEILHGTPRVRASSRSASSSNYAAAATDKGYVVLVVALLLTGVTGPTTLPVTTL